MSGPDDEVRHLDRDADRVQDATRHDAGDPRDPALYRHGLSSARAQLRDARRRARTAAAASSVPDLEERCHA